MWFSPWTVWVFLYVSDKFSFHPLSYPLKPILLSLGQTGSEGMASPNVWPTVYTCEMVNPLSGTGIPACQGKVSSDYIPCHQYSLKSDRDVWPTVNLCGVHFHTVGQAFLPVKTSLNVSDPVWADQKKIFVVPFGQTSSKGMASQMSDLPLMSVKKLSLQWDRHSCLSSHH
jgi:hypothetical protein